MKRNLINEAFSFQYGAWKAVVTFIIVFLCFQSRCLLLLNPKKNF